MADNSRVVEIKVDNAKAIEAIATMQGKIEELRKKEAELKKAMKDTNNVTDKQRQDLASNKEEQKGYAKQIQVLSKEIQNNMKLQDQQVGSLKNLRAELSNLTAEYDAMSKAEREGAEGQKLKNKINEITTELKGAEEATQRYYRNVGNYASTFGSMLAKQIPQMQNIKIVMQSFGDVFVDARKQMAVVINQFKEATQAAEETAEATEENAKSNKLLAYAQKTVTVATNGATTAWKLLKIAIAATGIGLLVVALGTLATYLSRTQAGTELWRKAMAGISATIDVILDRIAMLGSAIVSLFKGDFVEAAETAKNAFKGIGKEIKEETQTAIKLSEELQNIEFREKALTAQMAASKVQLAELKRIADDTTRSYAEREKAAKQALGIEINLAAKAKQLGEESIANTLGVAKGSEKLKTVLSQLAQGIDAREVTKSIGLSESTFSNYDKLVDQFNSYQQQVLEFTEKQVEGNNKLNTLRKERYAKEKEWNDEMLAIEKELDEERDKAFEEYMKRAEREWKLKLEAVVKGSAEEFDLRAQGLARQRDMELAQENTTAEMRRSIWLKYYNDMSALRNEAHAKEMEQMRLEWKNKIAEAQLEGEKTLQLEVERKKAELDALHQLEGESQAEFYARQLEAKQAYADAQKKVTDFEVAVEQAKYEAIENITSGLGQLFEEFGENNKALAIASKMLALAEVAINTGKAISAGVASASAVPFPGNIAAIGTTVATVLSNIVTATKTIKSAKFATGGYVSGAGSGTSDSIPSMLSNGESVNNALSTAMFSPLYSALNQLGGGIPIVPRSASEVGSIVEGEDMLARAVARGVSALHPVVSVEEINRVSDRVAFVKTLGDV